MATLPSTSTNVYEMNTQDGAEGGVDNAGAELDDDVKKEGTYEPVDAAAPAAAAAASAAADDSADTSAAADEGEKKTPPQIAPKPSVKKQDMGTDNPEFIKYPKE